MPPSPWQSILWAMQTFAFVLKWEESLHPRDKEGQFTEKGKGVSGGSETPASYLSEMTVRSKRTLTEAQQAMQAELETQAKKPVYKVKTPEEGVELILKGENVELADTQHVHTVLKALGEMAIRAKELGLKAPNFDPCLITVKGTSLFCTEKLKTEDFPNGIPRIEMPQFKSKNPVPGSPADKLPRNVENEVDATDVFLDHLITSGVQAENTTVPARKLKASQAEMEGVKVAGMMASPSYDPKTARIIVSKDNYVVDGHHTWAAAVGRDAEDGNLDNDMEMKVVKVDLPMSEIYHLSIDWTKRMGLPQAGVKKADRFVRSHVEGLYQAVPRKKKRKRVQGLFQEVPMDLAAIDASLTAANSRRS